MKKSRILAPVLAAAVLLTASGLSAREYGAGASYLGVGDAARATAAGPSALYINPAGLGRLMMFAFEAGYDYQRLTAGHAPHVAIADSKTNQHVAAGLGYTYLYADGGLADRAGHSMRVGLSSGYRSPTFSALFGAGGRYAKYDRSPGSEFEAFNLDVGALFDFYDMFSIGVVGHNVIVDDDALNAEMPIGLGLEIAFRYAGFTLSFDTLIDFKTEDEATPIYGVGAEYLVMGMVIARLGYKSDRLADAHYISGGFGYVSRLWGIDVSYSHNAKDDSDLIFATSIKFFLP